MPNLVAKLLIPNEVKEQSIGVFCTLTATVDAETFRAFVEKDVSLWQQIIPNEFKEEVKIGAQDYMQFIKMANESLVMEWVLEARPDLVSVLNSAEGRLWFYRQWAEITREIGV